MQRPSLLANNEDPLDALCHHFNVSRAVYTGGVPPPPTFDMPILRDAHMPTHVLQITESEADPTQPLMAPIDANLFALGFRSPIVPAPPPGTTSPVPHFTSQSQIQVVTLPVVQITVPHVGSIPLLLLFGLGLETDPNLMAWRLLPVEVIEEFPNAAAMSGVMSHIGDDRLKQYAILNQGLWKNVLAWGLRDPKITQIVQTAWNVTAEARRIRHRQRTARLAMQ